MKLQRIFYWTSTVLFTLLLSFSVYNYFFNYDLIVGFFKDLGYPVYIIYPLAIAKLLGLIVIWTNKVSWLKEWAYAGFFFNIVLAFFAHYVIKDGQQGGALMAFIFLLISYFLGKKVRP